MRGILIQIEAWNRRTASRVTVRAGAARNTLTLGADGFVWEPAVRRAPRLSQQLSDDDMTGQLTPGQGEFSIKVPNLLRVGDVADLDWVGSPVRIYSGDGRLTAGLRTEFYGRIKSGSPDADTGIAALTVEVDKSIVDVALLPRTYGGGGGADGDVELRGNTKPGGWGSPVNVRPILVNAVHQVYQVDAYGNMTGMLGVYENLASMGASFGDYATYAALVAAAIPEGRWATCFAEGFLRLGATAVGTITCDPVLGHGRPGAMMLRWLTTHAGVPLNRIVVWSFDALTAAVDAVVGDTATVSWWSADTGNVLDMMQRMCASCNAVPLLLFNGQIAVSQCIGGATAVTLNRQGGSPPVTAWRSSDPPVPWWRLKMPAARAIYVNSPSEIDYEDDIRDMGNYAAGETYRQGMVVRSPVDGARYIYVAAVPSAGTAPPDGNLKWELYESAPDITTIPYPGGGSLYDKTSFFDLQIESIVSDSVLSRAEKPQVVLNWYQIHDQFQALDAKYADLGYPADVVGVRDAAASALNALDLYLGGSAASWSDTSVDTPIAPADYRNAWQTATDAMENFAAAITGRPGADGASQFTLLNQYYTTVLPGGSTLLKNGGGDAYNGRARTRQSYPQATVSGRIRQSGGFIGLTSDPDSGAGFDTIDHAWHFSTDGSASVYNNGASPTGSMFNPDVDGVFTVTSDGETVSYLYNDEIKYQQATFTPNGALAAVFVIYHQNAQIDQIAFSPGGRAGASAITTDLNVSSIIIGATYDGQTKPGQIPRPFKFTIRRGSLDLTAYAVLGVGYSTGIHIGSLDANGNGVIDQIDAAGYVNVSAVLNGIDLGERRINITRNLDAPPAASSGQQPGSASGTIDSTSYSGLIGFVTIAANGAGQLFCTGGGEYSIEGQQSFAAAGSFAWRATGSTSWSYSTEVNGNIAASQDEEPASGSINITQTLTGLTAGASYDVGLALRKRTGTAASAYFTGSYQVRQ